MVLANLQRSQDEETHKHEIEFLHCTENDKTNGELDEKEVIDLCSESWTKTSEICNGKESRGNENLVTQRRAKQWQGWRFKTCLKRIIKQMKLRKLKR